MKKIAALIALAIASVGVAQAQAPSAATGLRPFLGAGLTFGGDDLSTVRYTDGTSETVKAGGVVQLTGGVDYRINSDFSLQTSISYHADSTSGSNGSVTFSRLPIELIGYYNVSPEWRIGVGARYVGSVKLSGSGAANGINASFDNTVGALIEGEYLMNDKVGLKIRFVSEKFTESYSKVKVSGNHIGGFANYYF
ncbi:MAG TPA: outer membrane beta-barrel protein [Telluria sp.]|nr:outer membrane beta-barrel protein [Telluria sp.]